MRKFIQILNNHYLFEKFLQKNALWVIMDPWYPTPFPEDVEKVTDIDHHNQKTVEKILVYLPNLSNVCVSCPKYARIKGKDIVDSDIQINVHPKLLHLYNTENKLNKLIALMKKQSLSIIVYCGFHYGDCIVFNQDGIKNTSKLFKTFVKKDLCALFPNELSWQEADEITKNYAEII